MCECWSCGGKSVGGGLSQMECTVGLFTWGIMPTNPNDTSMPCLKPVSKTILLYRHVRFFLQGV